MVHCSYGLCKNNARDKLKPHMQGVFFKRFPNKKWHMERCLRWIDACGRLNFGIEDITSNKGICSKHFVGGNGPTKEHPDPIPCLKRRRRRNTKITCTPDLIPNLEIVGPTQKIPNSGKVCPSVSVSLHLADVEQAVSEVKNSGQNSKPQGSLLLGDKSIQTSVEDSSESAINKPTSNSISNDLDTLKMHQLQTSKNTQSNILKQTHILQRKRNIEMATKLSEPKRNLPLANKSKWASGDSSENAINKPTMSNSVGIDLSTSEVAEILSQIAEISKSKRSSSKKRPSLSVKIIANKKASLEQGSTNNGPTLKNSADIETSKTAEVKKNSKLPAKRRRPRPRPLSPVHRSYEGSTNSGPPTSTVSVDTAEIAEISETTKVLPESHPQLPKKVIAPNKQASVAQGSERCTKDASTMTDVDSVDTVESNKLTNNTGENSALNLQATIENLPVKAPVIDKIQETTFPKDYNSISNSERCKLDKNLKIESVTYSELCCILEIYFKLGWVFQPFQDSFAMIYTKGFLITFTCRINKNNGSYEIFSLNELIQKEHPVYAECSAVVSKVVTVDDLKRLLFTLRLWKVCEGHTKPTYLERFKVRPQMSNRMCIRNYSEQAIHSLRCSILVNTRMTRCVNCNKLKGLKPYKPENAETEAARGANFSCNTRFLMLEGLRTRCRLFKSNNYNLKRAMKRLHLKIVELKKKIVQLAKEKLETQESELLGKTVGEMESHDARQKEVLLFLENQRSAFRVHKFAVRWDPLVMKWCSYIYGLSPKTYEAIRDSGFIKLPSPSGLSKYFEKIEMEIGNAIDVPDIRNTTDVPDIRNTTDVPEIPDITELVPSILSSEAAEVVADSSYCDLLSTFN